MLRPAYEAMPSTELSRACKEIVKRELGVMPFPDGDDAIVLKAAYFRFTPDSMGIAVGNDIRIAVSEDSLALFINRSCEPGGAMSKAFTIPIDDNTSFALALTDAVKRVSGGEDQLIQQHGREWCRIGNYKTLKIYSPYIDRLMAFCIQNPDLSVPLVASRQLKDMAPTPEVDLTLALMRGEALPEKEVDKINNSVKAIGDVAIVKDIKPKTDRQKKNQIDKLLRLGIGGGKDKPKPSDPRVRKIK